MPQLRHPMAYAGGRQGCGAANRPATGVRGASLPFGKVAMVANDTSQTTPTRRRGALRWFRLVVITLILINVVAMLFRLAWSSLTGNSQGATRRPSSAER